MNLTAIVLFALVTHQSIYAQEIRNTNRSQLNVGSGHVINNEEDSGDKMRASGCGDGSFRSETGAADERDGKRSAALRDGTPAATANAQPSLPGRSGDTTVRNNTKRRWIGLAKADASIIDETQKRKHNMSETTGKQKDWKNELSKEQYRVLREKGTEPAFSGTYYSHDENGNYHCAGCGTLLFTSGEKYHSGSGWPSFYAPADNQHVRIQKDASHGMIRDEVLCAHCGGHLGHVFDDGPQPTGQRYCINSVSLDFRQKQDE